MWKLMSGHILTFDVTMQIIAWMTNAAPYCYQNNFFQNRVRGDSIKFILLRRYKKRKNEMRPLIGRRIQGTDLFSNTVHYTVTIVVVLKPEEFMKS